MPITASMGALTYSRVNIGPDFTYWAMRVLGVSNGNPVQIFLHPSDFKIYVLNNISNTPNCYAIETGNNFNTPINVLFNKNYTFTYTNINVGPGFIKDVTSDVWITFGITLRKQYTPTFPVYIEGMPATTTISLANGDLLSSYNYRYVFEGIPPNDTWNGYFEKIVTPSGIYGSIEYIIANDYDHPGSGPTWNSTLARYQGGIATGFVRLGQNTARPRGSISVQLDSINQPITLWSGSVSYQLRTHGITAGPAPTYFLPTIYNSQININYPTSNTTAKDLKIDSNDNKIIITITDNASISFIHSITNDQTTFNWQKSIANVSLQESYIDSSNNVYIVGSAVISSVTRLYIFKFNNSGTLQWQRQMVHAQSLTNPKIIVDNYGGIIIAANNVSASVVFRLPSDGSIPGTGIYYYSGGTYTYSASSLTIATTTHTISAGALLYSDTPYNLINETGTITTPGSTTNTKIPIN